MDLAERVKTITPSSTLAITAKAKELKSQGYDVITLGAGEPDFNTPKHIIKSAAESAELGHTKYTPAGGMPLVKKAIVEQLSEYKSLTYTPDNVIVTTGAKHALYLTFQALLNPGDEVIIPAPYWVSYPEQVKLAGGKPVIVETSEENHFKMTADQLQGAITEKTKAVIINSPSNPTGMIYSQEEMKDLGSVCNQHDLTVVSDEIYDRLVYGDAEAISIASLSDDLKNRTVIINGVSKAYSMTGWRIGYAAASERLIKAMTNVASHSTSNPASISQHAALAAYTGSQAPVEEMRTAFESRLNYAFERLINIPGFTCIKPKGAFYLFPNVKRASEICQYASVTEFVEALLEKEQVALVPGAGFGSPDNVRLSYATSLEQIKEALDRIHRFVEGHIQ